MDILLNPKRHTRSYPDDRSRDVMRKTADVIVTDGFTGNVVLKTLEGGLRTLLNAVLGAFASEAHYKPHADALLPALMPLYAQMSPDTYGGAMLLGYLLGTLSIIGGAKMAARRCDHTRNCINPDELADN